VINVIVARDAQQEHEISHQWISAALLKITFLEAESVFKMSFFSLF